MIEKEQAYAMTEREIFRMAMEPQADGSQGFGAVFTTNAILALPHHPQYDDWTEGFRVWVLDAFDCALTLAIEAEFGDQAFCNLL